MPQDRLAALLAGTPVAKKPASPWEDRMAAVDTTELLPGVGRDPISDTNRALYQDDREAYNRKIYPRQMEAEDRARLGYGSAQEEMEDQYSKELELRTAPLHIKGQYDIEAAKASGDALGNRLQFQQDQLNQRQQYGQGQINARAQGGIGARNAMQTRKDAEGRARLVESGKTPINMPGGFSSVKRFFGMGDSEGDLRTQEANRIRSEGLQSDTENEEPSAASIAQELKTDYPGHSSEQYRQIVDQELKSATPEEKNAVLAILAGGG